MASLLKPPGLFSVFWPILTVWMASTRPLISKSSSLCTKSLVTVAGAPITNSVIVSFMFHSCFCSLAMSGYLSLFSLSFSFTPWSAGMAKSSIRQVLFLLIILWSGGLAEIRWFVYISYYHYYYLLLEGFSLQRKLLVFHCSLSDSKSPQVSKTFLGILTDLNSVVVSMVSIRPLISKSSRPYINSLVTVSKATNTIGITVTVTFHSFFPSVARWRY